MTISRCVLHSFENTNEYTSVIVVRRSKIRWSGLGTIYLKDDVSFYFILFIILDDRTQLTLNPAESTRDAK
jgi:hypothetical protein